MAARDQPDDELIRLHGLLLFAQISGPIWGDYIGFRDWGLGFRESLYYRPYGNFHVLFHSSYTRVGASLVSSTWRAISTTIK